VLNEIREISETNETQVIHDHSERNEIRGISETQDQNETQEVNDHSERPETESLIYLVRNHEKLLQ
jgi:hypothetical protein